MTHQQHFRDVWTYSVDVICSYTCTFEEAIQRLDEFEVLGRLEKANLKL